MASPRGPALQLTYENQETLGAATAQTLPWRPRPMAEGTHHARLVAGPLRLAQEGSGALLD